MLPTLITICVIIGASIFWVMSVQRRLVELDENVNNAMSQIGVQLSSRFDALVILLDLTRGYTKYEGDRLFEIIKSKRRVIMAKSTPNDVLSQEGVIYEGLCRVIRITEQHPEIKANQTYIIAIDVMQTFENMVRTSSLIYNDSVMKQNRELRKFPVSMIARILGFRQRDYLEE